MRWESGQREQAGQSSTPTALRWPPERFFWAVLTSPVGRPIAGVLPPSLYEALDEEVPVPGMTLHAVVSPLHDGQLLVCAAAREALEALPAGTLSLRPSALPAWMTALFPDDVVGHDVLSHVELLTGAYEPSPLRRAHRHRTALVGAALLLIGVLGVLGINRRAAAWSRAGEQAATLTASLVTEVSGASTPLALQRALEQQRSASRSPKGLTPPDAALALAGLLAVWPKDIEVDASSVSIAPTAMSLSLSVSGDARPLLAALKAPVGWTLDEPRISTAGSLTRVSLSLRCKGGL